MHLRTTEKRLLRSRIKEFYRFCNMEHWTGCYQLLDSQLREKGNFDIVSYTKNLAAFFKQYGPMRVVAILDVEIHPNAKRYEGRNFASGLVVWQDKKLYGYHLHMQRWVQSEEDGKWYTRLAGLVLYDPEQSLTISE